MSERTFLVTPGDTAENTVFAGRCKLHSIRPNLTTTGTITLRSIVSGGNVTFSVSAIGLTQEGKDFDGIVLPRGFTVQLSVGTDLSLIVYEPF